MIYKGKMVELAGDFIKPTNTVINQAVKLINLSIHCQFV